jgi:predicted ribosome quality control (RQC) complex YloA/Tae2 family protein
MTRAKTVVSVYGSLAPSDVQRLKNLAELRKKAPAALVREAVEWYLDDHERLEKDKKESTLEQRLKKMEDRLAKLQIRGNIDIGMVFLLMFRHMDLKERSKVVQWAYSGSVQRLRKKLGEDALELVEKVKEDDSVGSEA